MLSKPMLTDQSQTIYHTSCLLKEPSFSHSRLFLMDSSPLGPGVLCLARLKYLHAAEDTVEESVLPFEHIAAVLFVRVVNLPEKNDKKTISMVNMGVKLSVFSYFHICQLYDLSHPARIRLPLIYTVCQDVPRIFQTLRI